MQRAWGVPLYEAYSLTEAVTCITVQCEQGERLHHADLFSTFEVLDPGTEEPVQGGRPGVLVVTTFYPDRELMPVIRYWTDDLVVASPDPRCTCGAYTSQLLDVVGPADQMIKIGGDPFYP